MKLPIALCDLLHDSCEQPILHYGSLRGVGNVTHGEFQTSAIHDERHDRLQTGIGDSKIISHLLPGALCLSGSEQPFLPLPAEAFPWQDEDRFAASTEL